MAKQLGTHSLDVESTIADRQRDYKESNRAYDSSMREQLAGLLGLDIGKYNTLIGGSDALRSEGGGFWGNLGRILSSGAGAAAGFYTGRAI